MRLQKNTLLALYSALEFAANPERQVAASEIARKYRVSPHHLAKVLRTLGRAGLVGAVRGVGGGYRFAGNAKRLTLMDVIGLFEDISAPRRASAKGARRRTEAGASAAPHEVEDALGVVLAEIDEIAKATFSSITLATMLKLVERRRSRDG
ncbi:MAG TPA: Rrf2 family transcriptional regulator [Burkholderiales bacterium]|nr:Rrf2 family transcriptional regulator [Burkholderiales bacterium]